VSDIKNKKPKLETEKSSLPEERVIISASEAAKILGKKTADICRWIKKGKVTWGFVDEKDGAINNTYVIFKPAMLHWVNYGNTEIVNNIHITEEEFDKLGKMIITRKRPI